MKKARDLLKTLGSCRAHRSSNLVTLDRMEDLSNRYSYNPTLQWSPQVHDYFVKAYGSDHFSRISKALTRPACYSCIRVNTLRSTSDDVIEKLQAVMNKSGSENDLDSKRFSSEANNIRDLEFSGNIPLEQTEDKANPLRACFQPAPVSKCQIPGLDYVVFVQGSGPHNINYDYAHDRPPKEVLVSRKCAEAVLRGAQVYVPGVMACSAHVETGDTVAVSVAVEQPGVSGGWGIGMTRGTVLQGSQADPYYFERSGLYIGQGTTMMSRAGMFRACKGVAVDMKDRVYELPSFHNVLEGDIFLQNLPSIIAAHALDPQKGEHILDMCAAPGGKTTAIAILMKDDGEIIAADRSHNKVMDIQKLAAEMGLSCIKTYKLDALKAVCRRNEPDNLTGSYRGNADNGVTEQVSDSSILNAERMSSIDINRLYTEETMEENAVDNNERENKGTYVSKAEIRKSMRRERNGPGRNQCLGGRVEKSKGFPPNSFDRVLLDAPCSALGLRPRLFAGETSVKYIHEYADRNKDLLTFSKISRRYPENVLGCYSNCIFDSSLNNKSITSTLKETIESLRTHAKYQRRMFDQAVQLARPGGVIVYSTCTINPGENEALVRYALDKYKYLSLAPQNPRVGGPGLVGHCEFPDGYIEEWLRPGEEELVQRFDPSSTLDTIGFFIAKFVVGSKDTM